MRFAVGHVVARAGERVNWADVAVDRNGVKRKRISVLLGGLVRESSNDQLPRQVQKQAERIDPLERQLQRLGEIASRLDQAARNDGE